MISREQAREIAAVQAGRGIRDVRTLDELTVRAPMLYGGPALERCWIAYVEQEELWGLRASSIVLVDRQTGAVLYSGSAHDEG